MAHFTTIIENAEFGCTYPAWQQGIKFTKNTMNRKRHTELTALDIEKINESVELLKAFAVEESADVDNSAEFISARNRGRELWFAEVQQYLTTGSRLGIYG